MSIDIHHLRPTLQPFSEWVERNQTGNVYKVQYKDAFLCKLWPQNDTKYLSILLTAAQFFIPKESMKHIIVFIILIAPCAYNYS